MDTKAGFWYTYMPCLLKFRVHIRREAVGSPILYHSIKFHSGCPIIVYMYICHCNTSCHLIGYPYRYFKKYRDCSHRCAVNVINRALFVKR